MKPIITTIALAATLVAAQPHHHGHHHARHAEELAKRATETKVVSETVTVYVMDGQQVTAEEAQACIKSGECTVVSSSKSESGSNENADNAGTAGVFKETSTSKASKTAESQASKTASSSSAASSTKAASSNEASNVGVEFKSGDHDCGTFPTGYGAIYADWRKMNGWLGLQSGGTSNIVTGVAGDNCSPGSYCSYLCPEGYQKSQFPSTQGSSGQSIGGLYCNDNNKLELTNTNYKNLCIAGEGGVKIKNSLSDKVYVCRTDYPGTESMVIPIAAGAGETHDVTNPLQTYYIWQGSKTSAQYYLNPKGLSIDNACVWDSPSNPKSAGDKAPTILGTGVDGGATYMGLFPNSAVSSATLDYNVRITVDGSEVCTLVNGVYSGGSSGCTISATLGKSILVEFY